MTGFGKFAATRPTHAISDLVIQSGLFTSCGSERYVEDWVDHTFPKNDDTLVRIDPAGDDELRRNILTSLDLMKINHASLFPEIAGACSYANVISEDFF